MFSVAWIKLGYYALPLEKGKRLGKLLDFSAKATKAEVVMLRDTLRAVEVREVLSAVTVPVKPIVVSRLKQVEPSTCSAPLTVEPAWLMLPAKVKGGFPGTVDAALNCQLSVMSGIGGDTGLGVGGGTGGGAGDTGVGVGGGTTGGGVVEKVEVGAGPGAPLHPESRTVTESAKTVAKRFMSFLLNESWSSRRRIKWELGVQRPPRFVALISLFG